MIATSILHCISKVFSAADATLIGALGKCIGLTWHLLCSSISRIQIKGTNAHLSAVS